MDSSYQDLQCADLQHILKCLKAFLFRTKEGKIQVTYVIALMLLIFSGIDQNDSEKEASINQETTVRGKSYRHPCYDTGICWSRNLATIPAIDTFDATSFLLNYCGWSEERLRIRILDNGYKLNCSCHINDVTMAMLCTCKLRKAYHFIVLLTIRQYPHILLNFIKIVIKEPKK